MTDQPAFIRTIMAQEDPNNCGDACLVFSDWLDEQGRGREAWCLRRRVKMYQKAMAELKENWEKYQSQGIVKMGNWHFGARIITIKHEHKTLKEYIMRKFVRKPAKFHRLTMS